MSTPHPAPRPGPRPGPVPGRSGDDGLDGWEAPDADSVARARPAPSGIARVDAVVDGLADLGSRDLAEHPAAFEHAHTELRRALDEPAGGAG